MKIYISLILFLVFSCVQLQAFEEVAKFDLLISKVSKADLTLEGAIKVIIEPGWHMYYKDAGDFGLPTSIDYKGNTSSINIHWPKPEEHEDKVGKETFISNVYEGIVLFPFKVNVSSNQEYIDLNFCIKYAVCNKDRCIPKSAEVKTHKPLKDFQDDDINNLIKDWYKK